jgi:hypothetical protein
MRNALFHRQLSLVLVAALLSYTIWSLSPWRGRPLWAAAANEQRLGVRAAPSRAPGPTIAPYVRPELADRLQRLRATVRAAAARHNNSAISGMSDDEFATVITVILLNEHNGWLEDDIEPLRALTPIYQDLQRRANQSTFGGNFSVWPANLRPSVALEILEQQLPLPDGQQAMTLPLRVHGSRIDPSHFESQAELYRALTAEISQATLAIEYLAANLERGVYRALYEQAPLNWRTLAAWHNQGIVTPADIRANATARDYVRRASAYLALSEQFIAGYVQLAEQEHDASEPLARPRPL